MCGVSRRSAAGFTILELVAVLGILGVLAAAMMPLTELSLRRARESELRTALWRVREALDAHHRAAMSGDIARQEGESGYPMSLNSLVEGVPHARRSGERIYFLRQLPRDPFADPALASGSPSAGK